MTAAALTQIGAFWCLLVAAYWISVFPHDDDGIDPPLRRLAERSRWMAVGPGRDPLLAVTS